ncbi:MAG: alpha/beta hydrolase [Phycisphaerae bacterium]|nr:alpha/beta hydrolase [Saprospiraceae bacterium]
MKRKSRARKFFRRMAYVLLAILLVWIIAVQSGCFSMRTSDAEWAKKLQQKGQSIAPKFLDIVDKNGRRIHAVAISASDTLPLAVLVHGSPGSSDAYLDYLGDTMLTRKARLVAVDRPGFGHTEGFVKPEPSLDAQAAAVQAIANQLAPHEKVLLVGHSLGGPVIARFAMDYPEQTAGLVIVAGSIDPVQEEHPWWQSVVDVPPVKWLTPKALWTSNAEIIPLKKELEKMLPLWPCITCPVRIIHAVNDCLVPVANVDFAKKMLVNCPDLKVEILPDGDHFILWSREEKIAATLESLLHK